MDTTASSTDLLLHDIPRDLQERAAAAAQRAGWSLVDIVRMTLTRLADDGCLPFEEYGDEVPNDETLQAMRELEQPGPAYDSYEEAVAAARRALAGEAPC